jgi:ankyrin repeat protein
VPTRDQLSKAAEHKDEHTPLMIAALEGDTETVRTLLAHGARVNAKDNEGHTALMFAVINSHSEIVKALLRAGARVNARAGDGGTALMLAATNGDAEITQILLNDGAKTGYRYTSTGQTAATLAADRGHIAIVELLQKRVASENRGRSRRPSRHFERGA